MGYSMSDEALHSVMEAVASFASKTPEALALTQGDYGLSYRELDAEVSNASRRLRGLGIERGERVIIVGHNSWRWVVAYLATMRIGAICVPMNNRIAPKQVGELVDLLGARFVLSDLDHVALFSERPALAVYGLGENVGIGDLWHCTAIGTLPSMPDLESPALISFTSGTTGTPKGAVLSHRALVNGALAFVNTMEFTSEDSTLVVAPLFHNTGFNDQVGVMFLAGGRLDILSRYRTKDALAALKAHPVTFITAVPSVLRLMMTAENADVAFQKASTVLFGGSPMPAAWSSELLRRWPHLQLWHGYGLTEFTSCCTLLPPRLIERFGESIGFPPVGIELRLVGENGDDVPNGEVGEVWVAGATRMSSYWKLPEITAQKLEGKWLRTGDLGQYRDGLLYHVGRWDDVINRGGEKILPSYVESILAERPDVAQCVVFGVPDPVMQHRVLAAIEVREGLTFNQAAAVEHLADRLPKYALPEDFIIEASLPRTASGKIDGRAVRATYLERQGSPLATIKELQ